MVCRYRSFAPQGIVQFYALHRFGYVCCRRHRALCLSQKPRWDPMVATVRKVLRWILVPIVILENLQALLFTDLRARRMAWQYSSVAVVRLLVVVAASVYFLSARHMGLYGLFLGRLVGDAAAFLHLTTFCLRSIVFRISPGLIRPMIWFGLPLVWSVFAVMLQDASGRYFS